MIEQVKVKNLSPMLHNEELPCAVFALMNEICHLLNATVGTFHRNHAQHIEIIDQTYDHLLYFSAGIKYI